MVKVSQIGNITRLNNQLAQGKQHDKRNANAAHIASETFGFTLRSEIEDAEHLLQLLRVYRL